MSLSGASSAMGVPEALVERSAEARAAASGTAVDEILAAWAGGEAAPQPGPADRPEPAAEETTASEGTAPEPAPPVVIEVPQPTAPVEVPAPPSRAPVPAQVTAAEAAGLPEVVTVPTAGIKERPNFVIPRWLVGLLLVAPLVALFALGGSATGACGEATELRVDVISGQIVNCDGSEFTGAGAGGGGTDFVALGGDLYAGQVTPAASCFSCHGVNGQGGVGPALNGVLTTFGACEDHLQWVRLGSEGWRAQVGPTYGDTNKPVAPGMPSHAALTDEQLRSVVSFERVRFGGGNPDDVLADCGLIEGGETPAGGEGGTTGTTIAGEGGGGETTIPGDSGEASAGHSG